MKNDKKYSPAVLPETESERLEALYDLEILDSEPEARFDDLVEIAAYISGCPITLISLVDKDRQWFKAKHGLGADETDRDSAFCAHAILNNEILEVPDTREDHRFAGNPLVQGEPHIRFYAGAPLVNKDGLAYGTLCVIDQKPGKLTTEQSAMLQKLASQAVILMESRIGRLNALNTAKTLDLLLEALPDAVITCDNTGRLRRANRTAREWHGVNLIDIPRQQWQEYFKLFEPDGKTLSSLKNTPLTRAFEGKKILEEEYVLRAEGQTDRIVLCNADTVRDEAGRSLGAVVVMHDVTSIRQTSARAEETSSYLQAIIDSAVDVAIVTTDNSGTITLFNTGAEHMLGYTAHQVVGKQTPLLYHLPREIETRTRVLEEKLGMPIEPFQVLTHNLHERWTFVCRNGSKRQVRLSVSVIKDSSGKSKGFMGIAIDLTSQLAAEEAARLSGERFSGAFASAAQGMALVSLEGRWVEMNDALCDMLGYSRDELKALDFQSITHAEDLEMDLEQVNKLIKGEIGNYQLRKRYIRKDGSVMHGMLAVSLIFDKYGKPLHFVSQIQDITTQIQDSEALEESEHFLRALFDSVADAIVVLDSQGHVDNSNYAAREMLHLQKYSNISQVIPELSEHLKGLAGVSRYHETHLEFQALVDSGDPLPVALSLSAIALEGRNHWVAVIRDHREQKRIERMKDEFVSTVSHELRTPLTSISGALNLIEQGVLGEVPDTMREMLTIASQNSQRLTSIINDLLDMDKLIAGKMSFTYETLPLIPLLDEALDTMSSYAAPLQVPLERTGVDEVNVTVDSLRLMQVLNNLLSNACKFSPPGSRVTLHHETTPAGVLVSVIDRGSGIPEDFQERIFQKFSQAETSDTRNKGGTGLGLVICKELIEHMGGMIGFESKPGQGARFWFRLPITADWTRDLQKPEGALDILVVEDDPKCSELLITTLEQAGYRPTHAATLAKAEEFLKQQKFSALLLDLMLPDGDGLGLLHSEDFSLSDVPVLIITARRSNGDIELNGGASAVEWQSKPVHPPRLLNRLKHLLPANPEKRPQILHVEDDRDLARVIAATAAELGDFHLAMTISEAHDKLRQNHYDLLILDLNLPDGNGIRLWENLRITQPALPVVILSASEVDTPLAGPLTASLVKSKLSSAQLINTLNKLLNPNSEEAP